MIRGGLSSIVQRKAEANNPYLGTQGQVCRENEAACTKYGWDTTKPTSYIMYWNANNLYGWAMSQYLPIGEYAWLTSWLEHDTAQWAACTFQQQRLRQRAELTAKFTPAYTRLGQGPAGDWPSGYPSFTL